MLGGFSTQLWEQFMCSLRLSEIVHKWKIFKRLVVQKVDDSFSLNLRLDEVMQRSEENVKIPAAASLL